MLSMLSVRPLAAIAIAMLACIAQAREVRPSVVVIRAEAASESTWWRKLSDQGVSFPNVPSGPNPTANLAAWLSGCHELRAGVSHVRGGREWIRPDVPLMSEAFKAAGYRTAMFGEWGLGDALPFRPEDRGFADVLVLGGSGLNSPGDRWENSEVDPWLRDAKGWSRKSGPLPKVLAAEISSYLSSLAESKGSFFLQINLPKGCSAVGDSILADLDRLELPRCIVVGLAREPVQAPDPSNPWVISWRGKLPEKVVHTAPVSLSDGFATLATLSGVKTFKDWKSDGVDLSKSLLNPAEAFPERTFFLHPGGWPAEDAVDRHKSSHFSVRDSRWRVSELELFDLTKEPGSRSNCFDQHPEIATSLLMKYGAWWQSIRPSLLDPSRVIVGDERQKNVALNWSDWWPSRETDQAKGADDFPDQASLRTLLETLADPEKSKQVPSISGLWRLHASRPGYYKVTLWKLPAEAGAEERTRLGQLRAGMVHIRSGKFEVKTQLYQGATSVTLGVDLNEGPAELEAWFEGQNGEGKILGAFFATIERAGERKMPDPDWIVRPK
jgi:hypothetical protein